MDTKFLRQGIVLLVLGGLTVLTLPAQQAIPLRSRVGAAQTLSSPRGNLFPLAVGNSWTYSINDIGSDRLQTVKVTGSEKVGDTVYFVIEGFAGSSALARTTVGGQVVAYDRQAGRERLWYDFRLDAGVEWRSELLGECGGPASISTRGATQTEVPAGTFNDTVTVVYGPTQCADAGMSEEVFAPNVGLIRRTEITIAGPRTFELVEARIGSGVVSRPGASFELSIDRPLYYPNFMPVIGEADPIPTLHAKIRLANDTDLPLKLAFNSGQRFDLTILNAAGEGVYTWSANKLFIQEIAEIELVNDALAFFVDVPLAIANDPLPAGQYTVEAWITGGPAGLTRSPYRASVAFEMGGPVF